jgi:hypothetical protein
MFSFFFFFFFFFLFTSFVLPVHLLVSVALLPSLFLPSVFYLPFFSLHPLYLSLLPLRVFCCGLISIFLLPSPFFSFNQLFTCFLFTCFCSFSPRVHVTLLISKSRLCGVLLPLLLYTS